MKEISDKEILEVVRYEKNHFLMDQIHDAIKEEKERLEEEERIRKWGEELDALVQKLVGAKILDIKIKRYRTDIYESLSEITIKTDRGIITVSELYEKRVL